MESLRVQRRKAKNKSQILTMGGSGEYYIDKKEIETLAKIISSVNSKYLPELLDSLLTKKELVDISRRIIIAKMLLAEITYEEIAKKTGASKSTINLIKQSLGTNNKILGNSISKIVLIKRLNETDPLKKYVQNRIRKGK